MVPVALGAWAAGIAAIMVPHSAWLIAAGCGCLAALMLAFALLGNRASMSVLVIARAAASGPVRPSRYGYEAGTR